MGTDIHSVAQVRLDGKWKTVATRIAGDDRNYDTFAQLAGVRSGGRGFPLFSNPRGYPEDFSVEDRYNEEYEYTEDNIHVFGEVVPQERDWLFLDDEYRKKIMSEPYLYMGYHDHSYASLAELKEFQKVLSESSASKHFVVDEKTYKEYLLNGTTPDSYCVSVYGQNIVTLNEKEYLELCNEDKLPKKEIYVSFSWKEPAAQYSGIPSIIDSLEKYRDQYGVQDEDVRYVFGFDS